MIKSTLMSSVLLFGMVHGAAAEDWTLDASASHIAFGSVKNNYIGEVHAFSGLSGEVNAEGDASIDIELGSVETQIDIRNERMVEHVFNMAPSATLSTKIDMEQISKLELGQSTVMEIDFDLAFLGADVALYGEIFVLRITEDQVMVTTNNMVYVDTDELGIEAGIDKLQELASLDDITRAVPVTLRFVFNRDGNQDA